MPADDINTKKIKKYSTTNLPDIKIEAVIKLDMALKRKVHNMRKHTVKCVVQNCNEGNALTGEVNRFWKDVLRERMRELGLTQEEQISLIDRIIENVQKNNGGTQ